METEKLNPKQGKRLKELLNDYGITQKELADKLHYSEPHISRIANGHSPLTLATAKRICEYVNSISVDAAPIRYQWLMGMDDFKTAVDQLEDRDKKWKVNIESRSECVKLITEILELVKSEEFAAISPEGLQMILAYMKMLIASGLYKRELLDTGVKVIASRPPNSFPAKPDKEE